MVFAKTQKEEGQATGRMQADGTEMRVLVLNGKGQLFCS